MTLSFRYRHLPGKKGSNHKSPAIDVRLKGSSEFSPSVIALVDSGADISVIPLDLAEFLGLDLSWEVSQSYGIGGEVRSKRSKVQVLLKKGHEKYTFTVPVEVLLDGDPPIILGRNMFFNKFVISIDEKNQRVKLKRNAEKGSS